MPVDGKVKVVLSILFLLLFVGSMLGLVLTLTAGGDEGVPEPRLEASLYPTEEILTCAYKSYGSDEAAMYAAKTIIRNVGEVPVENSRLSYKIEGFCE